MWQIGSSFSNRSRTFPVHREAERHPVGFDHAGERINAVLGPVDGSLNHEVVARFGPEQRGDVERQDAVAKVADRRRGRPRIGADDHGIQAGLPRPSGGEARRRQHLPAVAIGDVQREAAIGEPLVGLLHPLRSSGAGRMINGASPMTKAVILPGSLAAVSSLTRPPRGWW